MAYKYINIYKFPIDIIAFNFFYNGKTTNIYFGSFSESSL